MIPEPLYLMGECSVCGALRGQIHAAHCALERTILGDREYRDLEHQMSRAITWRQRARSRAEWARADRQCTEIEQAMGLRRAELRIAYERGAA